MQTSDAPVFEIVMESDAVIRGELFPHLAPETVGNFAALANSGFYDGLPFHRCIRDYLIQAGFSPMSPLSYCIQGEFEFNDNKRRPTPEYGSLCMSHGTAYNSGNSEFFIVLTDNEQELRLLDGAYAQFGKVHEGLRRAAALSTVAVKPHTYVPQRPQIIRRIRVETFGVSYPFQKLPYIDPFEAKTSNKKEG